jgi:hypothetical protein
MRTPSTIKGQQDNAIGHNTSSLITLDPHSH